LFLIFSGTVNATVPEWNTHDFRVRAWGVAEGLPGNHISALAQDADGFLWLATLTGVVRFDGHRFQTFDASGGELPSSRFTALDIGPSGRLWLGSEQGHLIVRENGRFRVVVPPHYPGHEVGEIAEAADGSVWFTQGLTPREQERSTLFHWIEGKTALRQDLESSFRRYPRAREYNALDEPGGTLTLENRFPELVLVRDADSAVWARSFGGSSVRLADGTADPVGPGSTPVLMFANAGLHARSGPAGVDIVALPGGERLATLPHDPERLRGVWLRDRRGLLWVSVRDGLEAWAPGASAPLFTLPMDSLVHEMIEDREGTLWLATRTRGLLQLTPNPVRHFGPEQGLPLPARLWKLPDGRSVMSMQLLEQKERDGLHVMLALRPDGGVPQQEVLTSWLLETGERPEWSADSSFGVLWRGPDGRVHRVNQSTAMIYRDPYRADRVCGFGLTVFCLRISGTAPPEQIAEWALVAQTPLLFDADGGLWLGTAEGLHHLIGDQQTTFTPDDGLPVPDVRALLRGPGNTLWIASYGGGLVHFDGQRFKAIDQRAGLLDNALSGILADDHGAFWLAGNRGIQRVLVSDLEDLLAGRVARIPAVLYGREHGIDNPETTGAFSALAVGPYLYFSTFGGLVRIDPERVAALEATPPSAYLLDEHDNPLGGSGQGLILDQARRDLSLRYTAIHMAASDTLRFRYRLLGLDDVWIDGDGEREARFSRLPPGDYQFEVQARHAGGPWVSAPLPASIEVVPLWWETGAAKVFGLCLLGALLVAAWRVANGQVRRRAEALEALVGERTAALAEQSQRLQALAEGRARFMSGISHELRTPLSLILSPLKDLGEGMHGELPDSARKELARIERNGRRLLRLVERLLEVARVESGGQTLHCRESDLGAAILSLVEQLQPIAGQRGSTLVARIPPLPVPVWFDPLLMESVLINLMVNGLRHTPAGSRVEVVLEAPDADGAIVLRVRDNGPGIPADALPHLFERFYRVRGEHASGAEGFGLGLPLVREVVERHGGRVDVQSSDAGSCFTLTLQSGRAHLGDADVANSPPATRPQASLLPPPEPSLPDPSMSESKPIEEDHRRLVLVVDDNAELRRLVGSYLMPRYRVHEADTGASALVSIAAHLPDLVVSDIMMPVMDGHALCKALRSSPDTDFIPILMLTAKAGLEHRIEGLEEGADAYLSKPFDRRELVATIDGLIANRQRLQAHYLRSTGSPDHAATPPAEEPASAPPQEGSRSTEPSRYVQRLTAVIEAHLADERFDVDALAVAMAQDRTTLYRTVKSHCGVAPSEILREARLLRSRALLRAGEGTVSEVAYAVGFKTVAHFSNSYRQRFGETPSKELKGGLRDPS
jgi:signal transduction histidine kinase/DNA-binding response OmpR family regulator/ligand-binding sensor domain-containing protein